MVDVLLGLGGNLGDPRDTIETALKRLEAAGPRVQARSSAYRTAPWGNLDQADFTNLCAAVSTDLPPRRLLDLIQRVETELGRERRERWGPRTIDIDILTYGDEVIDEPGLILPHPRLTERAFVLVPLAEIAPDRLIGRRTIRDWAAAIDRKGVQRLDA